MTRRLPENQAKSIAVIDPIGLDTNLNSLKDEICAKYQDAFKIERIYKVKGRDKEPTLCVKIYFDNPKFPDHIYLWYQRFKTRIFVDKPWQRFRCKVLDTMPQNVGVRLGA